MFFALFNLQQKTMLKQLLRALFFPLSMIWNLLFATRAQVERIIHVKHLLRGKKLVHLSDFHCNVHATRKRWYQHLSLENLQHVITQVNALQPDVVCMTGDFVQADASCIDTFCLYMKQLKCKHILAVMGNHGNKHDMFVTIVDIKEDKRKIVEALQSVNVQVLDGTSVIIDHVEYVGFLDYYDTQFNTVYAKQTMELAQTKQAAMRIILSHNPDTQKRIVQDKWLCDLMLCGHAHGGQICVYLPRAFMWWLPAHTRLECATQFWIRYPIIPMVNSIVNLFPQVIRQLVIKLPLAGRFLRVVKNWEYAIGLSRLPNDSQTYIYTHRGIGTHFPCRFLCPPEITVFE